MTRIPVALLSVYHKDGIVEFARELKELGFAILASGGTAKHLEAAGIRVRDVASMVGSPILGHRVVTLSREIHAGLLARDCPEDLAELERLSVPFIDLVCVDLYPLAEEIAKPEATRNSVIEKTDIGGPTMLRSAAKGRRIVVCDPTDRAMVVDWLKSDRPDADAMVTELVAKAERIISSYCLDSARYHSDGDVDGMIGTKVRDLCYGENRHQQPAGLFALDTNDELALHRFEQIGGGDPSYINMTDLDRLVKTLVRVLQSHPALFVAIAVKHGNCCGAGVSHDESAAIERMIESDPTSILGGWVMTNFPINRELATILRTHRSSGRPNLFDGVVAPAFSDGASEMLDRKAGKCRMFVNPALETDRKPETGFMIRPVRGGFLRQPVSAFTLDLDDHRVVVHGPPLTTKQRCDLLLAWAIGSTSNSNTITLVSGNKLIANAVGQQSRVRAAKLALMIAEESGHDVHDAVAWSDSFFPFPDGPKVLTDAGVKVIFASSGSVNDKLVVEHCVNAGVTLVMLPDATCRGFFGH